MMLTLSFFAIGYLITGWFGLKNKLERLGSGYLLIFGLIGFILFGLTTIGVRMTYNFVWIIIILGTLSAITCLKDLKRIKFNGWWLIIIGVVLLSILINYYWPVSTWDALTMYDFRARFFAEGRLPIELKNINEYGYYLGTYPFNYSLVLALPYIIGEPSSILIIGMFFSLMVVISTHLSSIKSDEAKLFVLLISISTILFSHSTYVYSNLPYSVFLIAGVFYMYKFWDGKHIKMLILMSLMLLFSFWTRQSEPFFAIPYLLLLLGFLRKRDYKICILISITTLIILFSRQLWTNYVYHFQEVNQFSIIDKITQTNGSSVLLSISKINEIGFITYLKYIVSVVDIYIPLILLTILETLFVLKKRTVNLNDCPFFVFTVCSLILFIFGVLAFSITVPNWETIPDSARRMMMFIVPTSIAGFYEVYFCQKNT